MFSLRSFMTKSFPNMRRFYGSPRTLFTQKSDGGVHMSEDQKTAIVPTHLSFLPDRAGMMPLTKIPQLLEEAAQTIGKSGLLPIPGAYERESGVITVLKTQEVKIFPEFYSYMKPNSYLSVHCNVRDFGSKSFNLQFHIYDETSTVLLCRNTRVVVVCDLKLKPVPIPPPLLEFLTSFALKKERYFCPQPFTQKSGNVFDTHVVPRPSDLDTLYHVNQANYVVFMLDAAVRAAKTGFYKSLRQDIAFGSIDQIIFNYSKELCLDESVHIETWQKEENPLSICFQMSTHSQLAFQGSILLQKPLLQLSDEIKKRLPRAKEF